MLSNAVRNLVDKTTEVPVDPLQPGEEFHPSRYAESSDESDNEYSDTSQDEASGGTRTIFYPRANVLIKNLKDDPNDEDAYERIRRLNDEIKRHLEEESPDEMDDGITIDVEAFREKYRAINSYAGSLRRNPMDEAARRKAETLIDELNDFIAKNRYPKSWAISIPYFAKSSELHTSTPPNFPRTRLGEVICAHRTWVTGYKEDGSPKNAYLIAILPNDNIPIGEIWSGTAIGEEAKNSYLASNMAEHIWKPDKRELGELKTRFKKVLRVFVQPSSKKETWVSILLGPRSSTDPPEETRVITRSNLIAFRKRADAFNDIADVYKKQGKDVPAHIAKTEPRQQRLAKNALQDTSNYANQSYSTMENARALKDLLLESGVNVQKRQNLEMGETAALVNAMLREQQNKNGHKSQHAFAQHGGSATNTNQDLRVEALESRIDELTAAVKEIAVGMRAREATG